MKKLLPSLVLIFGATLQAAVAQDGSTPIITHVQEQDLAAAPSELVRGLEAKILRADADAAPLALKVDVPAGFSDQTTEFYDAPMELFVLGGALTVGPVAFEQYDFLRVPAGAPVGPIASADGAEILVFFDGPARPVESDAPAEPSAWQIVDTSEQSWASSVVTREAGQEIPIEIMHFKNDPETGARTHLVRAYAGTVVPWESHDAAEEGYLVKGRHSMDECLPDGVKRVTYEAGGYFYRIGGPLHMGPDSPFTEETIWLIRTPEPIIVTFHESCPTADAAKN